MAGQPIQGYRGGVRRPEVTTGAADPVRARVARKAVSAGGVGMYRQAGMMLDTVQTNHPYSSGYRLDAYRSSYANGLDQRSGTYDVPTYFVQMNDQNGGILYWPVTLQEKYQWYRYWARCFFLNDSDLGNVLMADGTVKRINNVEIGDEVITGLGTIRKVKDKYKRYKTSEAYRIKWAGMPGLTCTHHHPFYVFDGASTEKKYIRDIKKGEWIVADIPSFVISSDIDKDKARLLGYFAAEGSFLSKDGEIAYTRPSARGNGKFPATKMGEHKETIGENKRLTGIRFTLNEDELPTLGRDIERLCKLLTGKDVVYYGDKRDYKGRKNKTVEIRLNDIDAATFCLKHVGRGAKTKKLSRELVFADKEIQKEFLQSYVLGDGEKSARGICRISTTSIDLASQSRLMLARCGYPAYISQGKTKSSGCVELKEDGDYFHVNLSKRVFAAFCEDKPFEKGPWSNIYIQGNKFFTKIKEVEYKGEISDFCYNISIDAETVDERSYCIDGLCASKNTDAYVGRALELLSELPMSKLSLHLPKDVPENMREEILEKFEYQMEVIDAFTLCQDILWERNMIGNCFEPHMRVHTNNGMMPICQVRSGDLVLTQSGRYCSVVNVMRRKARERLVVLDIARQNQLEWACTGEHPVFIWRNNREMMVKASEVRKGDFVSMWKPPSDIDVDKVNIVSEVEDSIGPLSGRYDNFSINDEHDFYSAKLEYKTRLGVSSRNEDVRDALLNWLKAIDTPRVFDCKELSEFLNVDSHERLRTIAYSLKKKGVINYNRTSHGRKGGSAIEWFPIDAIPSDCEIYSREWEKTLTSHIREVEVNNSFLYVLGYWLGDGWLWRYKRQRSHFYKAFDICAEKESPCIPLVETLMRDVFGENFQFSHKGSYCDDELSHFVVEDELFCEWWGHNFGHDCETKRIPEWVQRLPKEKLIWILRGLIDSDGCVSGTSKKAVARIYSTNEEMAQDIFRIGLKCGIPFSFGRSESQSKLTNGKTKNSNKAMFCLSIGESDKVSYLSMGCAKEMFVSSENAAPYRNYVENDGNFYFKVNDVGEKFYDGYVYNVEVEGDHTYCIENVNTHNCSIFHEWDAKRKLWSRAVMLPPEEVYIFELPFAPGSKQVQYRPERLISLIMAGENQAGETFGCDNAQGNLQNKILENIPQELVEMVRDSGCIIMDTDPMTGSFVHHIARGKSRYHDLGASVLERVLIPMLQKEHFRYTQLSLASRNMTPKNLVTANGLLPSELDDLRMQIDLSYLDPDYTIVTNYDVQWDQIGAQDRLLDLSTEYERIESQVFAALGVTRELLTGEGSFSGNKITVEILNTMFLNTRNVLTSYIERELFMPIAEAHGWFEEKKNGVKKYWYPKVGFNRLTIRDNAEVFDSLFQLYQKGSLDIDVIYELFNINSDEMSRRLKAQLFTVKDSTFNRMVEDVNSEVGRSMVEKTDIVERVAEYLGLKYKEEAEGQEGGGGFGDFDFGGDEVGGGEFGEAPTEEAPTEEAPTEEAPTEEAPNEEANEGDDVDKLEAIVEAVTSELPPDASDEEIEEIVKQVAEDV